MPFAGMHGGWMMQQRAPPIVSGLGREASNWHHFAVSWNKTSGATTYYLDGQKSFTSTSYDMLGNQTFLERTAFITLGRQCATTRWPEYNFPTCGSTKDGATNFVGELDDVAVFGAVLDEAQIADRWNASLADRLGAGLEPHLVLFWDFEEVRPNETDAVANWGSAGADYDLLLGRYERALPYLGKAVSAEEVPSLSIPLIGPRRVAFAPSGAATHRVSSADAPLVAPSCSLGGDWLTGGGSVELTSPAGQQLSLPCSSDCMRRNASTTAAQPHVHTIVDGDGTALTIHLLPCEPTLSPAELVDRVQLPNVPGNTVDNFYRHFFIRPTTVGNTSLELWGVNPQGSALPVRVAMETPPHYGTMSAFEGQDDLTSAQLFEYELHADAGLAVDHLDFRLVVDGLPSLSSGTTRMDLTVPGRYAKPEVPPLTTSLIEEDSGTFATVLVGDGVQGCVEPEGCVTMVRVHKVEVFASDDSTPDEVVDLFVDTLPTKGRVYANLSEGSPHLVEIAHPYNVFEIESLNVVSYYPERILKVSSFWGASHPMDLSYHPVHLLGEPDCDGVYGECEHLNALPRVGKPVLLNGTWWRVVNTTDGGELVIDLMPMWRLEAGAMQRCNMYPRSQPGVGGPPSYPQDCYLSDENITLVVSSQAVQPATAGLAWSPALKLREDGEWPASPMSGAFGPEYAFPHGQTSNTEYIEFAISEAVYLLSVEVGMPRGMGAITAMKVRRGGRGGDSGGGWYQIYGEDALTGLRNADRNEFHRWRPTICRPHMAVSEFRLELDTSTATGIADWNYVDWVRVWGSPVSAFALTSRAGLKAGALPPGVREIYYATKEHQNGNDTIVYGASDCAGDPDRTQRSLITVYIQPVNDPPEGYNEALGDVPVLRVVRDIDQSVAFELPVYDPDGSDDLSCSRITLKSLPCCSRARPAENGPYISELPAALDKAPFFPVTNCTSLNPCGDSAFGAKASFRIFLEWWSESISPYSFNAGYSCMPCQRRNGNESASAELVDTWATNPDLDADPTSVIDTQIVYEVTTLSCGASSNGRGRSLITSEEIMPIVLVDAVSETLTATSGANVAVVISSVVISAVLVSLVVLYFVRQRVQAAEQRKELCLTYQDTDELVVLAPPVLGEPGEQSFHFFLSHVWRWGQDQAGTLKSSFNTMLPECQSFLDVDNLKSINKLEQNIANSETILVVLTRDYFSSHFCRKELLYAHQQDKAVVLLMETDDNKGAPTLATLQLEHDRFVEARLHETGEEELSGEDRQMSEAMLELIARTRNPAEGGYIEWHREKHMKRAGLTRLAEALIREHHRLSSEGAKAAGKGKAHTCTRGPGASLPPDFAPPELTGGSAQGSAKKARLEAATGPGIGCLAKPKKSGKGGNVKGEVIKLASTSVSVDSSKAMGRIQESVASLEPSTSIATPGFWEFHRPMRLGRDKELPADGKAAASIRIYVAPAYESIEQTGAPGRNMYDSIVSQLSERFGAAVYSDDQHHPGDFFLLLLCPGFFQNAALCRMASNLLSLGVPTRRAKDGGTLLEESTVPKPIGRWSMAPRSLTRSRRTDQAVSVRSESTSKLSGSFQQIINLYSTAVPFAEYIRDCPSDLASLGIFSPIYAKWPATPLMQAAAIEHACINCLAAQAASVAPTPTTMGRMASRAAATISSFGRSFRASSIQSASLADGLVVSHSTKVRRMAERPSIDRKRAFGSALWAAQGYRWSTPAPSTSRESMPGVTLEKNSLA